MTYVDLKNIEKAREMDLLTYLKNFEPYELVRLSDGTYCTKTHDSLKISNGKWMWWSRGFGGVSALDYLIKVKGYEFLKAVNTILNNGVSVVSSYNPQPKKAKEKLLLLPKKSTSNTVIIKYLCSRGIDLEITNLCISQGKIFESIPYHNVVFVGFDKENKPKYASYRDTKGRRILGDCSGSDKHYSFRLADGNSNTVHLFECPIDLLSYATLLKMKGYDYTKYNLLSLAGIYSPSKSKELSKVPVALENYLKDYPNTNRIAIHFDNDVKGIEAANALKNRLEKTYEVVLLPPKQGKDFNDFLCLQLNINNKSNERKYVER